MSFPSARLDHIVILVRSLSASLPYYRTLLPLLGYAPDGEMAWTGGGLALVFKEAAVGTAEYNRYAPGVNHLGLVAADVGELTRVQHAMRLAGFEAPEMQWFEEAAALFMKDPDGIRFEISTSLPANAAG